MELKKTYFEKFPVSELKPSGYLLRQLEIQAQGLNGRLDRVWSDIRDSAWLGGKAEGWERFPYWLDGFIPLSFLLDDPEMKKKCQKYINIIISSQCEDGWICPCLPEERANYDTWAIILTAKVLMLWYEITGDRKAADCVYRVFKNLESHIQVYPLSGWGRSRWYEALIPLYALYYLYKEDWLLTLAKKLQSQGADWYKLFSPETIIKTPENIWKQETHVVNHAMMLKEYSLISRLDGGDPDSQALDMQSKLFEYHGTAAGHFSGDECLAGLMPTRGTELCGVVEAMYSYETLLACSGNVHWADCIEALAFNAFPATVSVDMKTHQYLQLTNQPQCTVFPENANIFGTNSPSAHLFGLEPNYGCCTANFGQGFPKLAMNALYRSEKGVTAALLLPCDLKTKINGVGVSIRCITEYPFDDKVRYEIDAEAPVEFTFAVRVPSTADGATLNGKPVKIGEYAEITGMFFHEVVELALLNTVKIEKRPGGLACVKRGCLLFSLPVKARWEIQEHKNGNWDIDDTAYLYSLYPESRWNYAISADGMVFHKGKIGAFPFSRADFPVFIKCRGRELDWDFNNGMCADVPGQVDDSAPEVALRLVPYGCTDLRITETMVY